MTDSKALLEGVTPGPWEVRTDHRWGHDRMIETWYVHTPSNRVGIAVQPAFSDDTNAEANARLIAAAPLLAAEHARMKEALEKIGSQAICFGMRADESELRDWLRFISETAEAALNGDPS